MAAEVLSHHQVPTAKPEEAGTPDADAGNPTKRNYVPIRPAYRPLLPKPTTRDSTPSPIHIHTRTSGLSQLARKRQSGVAGKIDAVKRRRSLATRAADTVRGVAPDVKAEPKPNTARSAHSDASTRSSPSPTTSGVSSPTVMESPNMTSVSTRSIFGPPPTQDMDVLASGVASPPFEADLPKPRTASGSMTSMMSAIVSRFQQTPTQPLVAGAGDASALDSAAVSDISPQAPGMFTPLSVYDDMPLEQLDLEQFSKLDMDLEPALSSSTSSSTGAPSLASSATTVSTSASDSVTTLASMPEDMKKLASASPDAFGGYGSPGADFDDFTDLYFHSGTHFDSVTPTDGSPETLGDVLDNEVGLVDKTIQDDLSMMDFLAPIDLFNA